MEERGRREGRGESEREGEIEKIEPVSKTRPVQGQTLVDLVYSLLVLVVKSSHH